jgi:AcrR family transcriptional regulator
MQRGRPRQFDPDEAVDIAMRLFWERGFVGTTIPDLTEAIGINRPSLYAAFGSKEALFLRTLARYRSDPASYVNRALAKTTAYEVFESLLSGVIALLTDKKNPGGCLFVNGAFVAKDANSIAFNEIRRYRRNGESDIRKRFHRAVKEGDLPPDTNTNALAKFAATQIWGLSVQSMNGARKAELVDAANIALRAFASYTRSS